ncbi:hypothetical protein [Streptomyces sp. Amel2xB2]|uniref:hypothetical protein n=1 Tax=Streptomyces sp. Amel2xB2 TaxID=1305829 RepID=UPI000DBAB284|nr:hypothetical protein [Streptomyces sp. Amel2xB2]
MSAAVRPPHPAVVRRALLTLLFLGGFLVLAVLFGGSAHAASGTDGADGTEQRGRAAAGLLTSESGGGPASGDATGAASGHAASGASAHQAAEQGLSKARLTEERRRAAQQAAERAAAHVMGPVADGADGAAAATRPVGHVVGEVTGPEGLGGLPGRLGLEDRLGGGPGEGSDGGGHDAGHGASGMPEATGHGTDGSADGPRTQGSWASSSTGSLPGTQDGARADDGATGGSGDPADGLPFHGTPAVPAPGASPYAGDSQSQRGGPHEQSAVLAGTADSGSLLPGAVRAADGTPTRDSAGDVLEFPG